MQGNAVVEPNPAAKNARSLDIFRREIYSADVAPTSAGRKASGSTKTTPDIEDMLFGREIELTEKIFGCLAATDMKLIDGSKIVDRDGVDRLAERFDAAADRCNQVAVRVVRGDILLRRHR